MSVISKGDVVKLGLYDLNNLGCGVGRLDDGRVVFVAGGVAGDKVTAKIIKVNKSYCVARLEKIDEPSPVREKHDLCGAPESCGGCVYRHVTYAEELRLKREYVAGVFRKAGIGNALVGEVRSTGAVCGYRNKAQYPVQSVKGRIVSGFYASKTHKVTANYDCPLQPAIFAEIVGYICRFAEKHKIPAYGETTGRGILRHIYIREGMGTGQIMVCPVLRERHPAFDDAFASGLTAEFPQVNCVMLNINRKNTNVVTGDEYITLKGNGYIEDKLLGLTFRITPGSFWQVNHDGAELLYSIAKEKAGLTGNEHLLDLYCGTGSIGLTMADRAVGLVGIEITPSAVECAKLNAEINGISNARFFCGDASATSDIIASVESGSGEKIKSDVVILDPPRKGSTPELIGYIAARGIKKVIYVSCGPDTLARDCSLFISHGYHIDGEITPVDMFPRTGHVETVVCLKK